VKHIDLSPVSLGEASIKIGASPPAPIGGGKQTLIKCQLIPKAGKLGLSRHEAA